MLEFLFLIAFLICLKWVIQSLIGVPLVYWEKIQDYQSGQMPQKEIRLWKVALILFSIIALLLTFIVLGINKG
ncbi:MAG: hypothetical protein Q4A09_05290 [Capnocytophaga felis]|nr:hypothetical protein [Capnocytophaga felis]